MAGGEVAGTGGNPALVRALETIRALRAQLAARRADADLAVVGAGVRLPGGIDTLNGYWEVLAEGRDLVGALPAGRRGPDPAAWAGVPQRGGFLGEVLEFDADYFGVSPREAAALDPQHRLVLEVAVEALEHAALPPDRLAAAGLRTGLYLGISAMEYREWMGDEPDAYWATGSGHCFAAGRVAHTLGLTGPALAVDTACSSSLVAVHLARRALAAGECDVALAGGVNLVLSARSMRLLAATGSLAPDGLCKPFDARADGFARGEGCGLVVLKRAADARRDGDRILGLIRGTAVNHDGRATGFTVPNVRSQAALAEAALADAGLEPADIGLIEAHGTGTALGDPIEIDALSTAVGRRNGGARLPIGAVKANLGHLESAAGVAGLIKALLCLEHRAVPPLVHFRTLNPRIDFSGTGITVPTEVEPWPAGRGRHVLVSSFGMSGTNAQAIVAPAEVNADADAEPELSPESISGHFSGNGAVSGDSAGGRVAGFELAAKSPQALTIMAARLAARLAEIIDDDYPAFAYTVTYGRTRHRFRAWVSAAERATALEALRALAEGRDFEAVDCYEGERRDAVSAAQPAPPTSLRRNVIDLPHYPWQRTRHPAAPASETTPLFTLAWDPIDIPAPAADSATAVVIAGDDDELVALLKTAAAASGVAVVNSGSQARDVPLILAPRATPLPDSFVGDPAAAGAQLCTQVAAAVAESAAHTGGRIIVLTRGARQVTGQDPIRASDHGLLHGLAPVLGLEFPAAWGAVIDLPADPDAADAAAALDLARHLGDGAPDLLAVRAGRALAAALVPAEPAPAGPAPGTPLRPDATYLVTGALGGVGRAITASLAARGARHLLLLGRRGEAELGDAGAELLWALRADGVNVVYRAADCADPVALARACAIPAELPPVRGIVHAAGVVVQAPPGAAAVAEFAEAAGAKYAGAWWLHLLAREWPLDFFVVTSSVSALWGMAGHAPYAAANGGLDLIAAYRLAVGSPAASIAFGPWDLDGIVDDADRRRLARLGLGALPPGRGCAAVAAHAPGRGGYAVAAEADWPAFAAAMDALRRRPLLDRVSAAPPAAAPTAPTALIGTAAPAADGESAGPASAHVPVDVSGLSVPDAVAAITAAILGHTDPGRLRRDTGFQDLGLDSIMAVELARALTAAFGRPVAVTDLYDHPTPEALAAYIAIPAPDPAVAPAAPSPAALSPAQAQAPLRVPALVSGSAPVTAEPIALVGLAGRFPGADSVEEFWDLLDSGRDGVGPIPPGRRDGPRESDAGFLSEVARFDAAFFGLSAREAHSLDPQHRLLLEASWHALEDAGIDPRSLHGTRTGVFVGISNADYTRLLEQQGLDTLDGHFATGNALNAAAGRVAFLLGLRGPALAVDTACSSSLVALHLAVRSLRAGETDCVIVGGVNVLAAATASVAAGRAHMLSPTGRCRTFSAAADGFVRSEGCGVVVLKRLADARRDRDRVQALVLGTAVNQDGASSALTAPNGTAQTEVIAEALADAGLPGSAVSYLEAHGTGTELGDPVEVQAALRVLGVGRSAAEPLLLGSVKSNVGHLESAAGITGVIKAVLALRHGRIPGGLHCEELNPHIPWQGLNARVVDRSTAWGDVGRARVAGVSAFGFTGTNAHVVLGEAVPWEEREPAGPVAAGPVAAGPVLLPLSAADPAGLERLAQAWRPALAAVAEAAEKAEALDPAAVADSVQSADPDRGLPALAELALTAGVGRAQLPIRRALFGTSAADLLAELTDLADLGEPGTFGGFGDRALPPAGGRQPRVLFLFPGQGSQYFGMGRRLYAAEPVFRSVLDACSAVAEKRLGASLTDLMFAGSDAEAINRTDVTQPALVAFELALAQLWRSWGVTPAAVLGHSVGEISAAVLAEVLDQDTAMHLAVERGRLMQGTEPGAMLAVAAPPEQVRGWLAGRDLDLAAENGPVAATVAGPVGAVQQFAAWLSEQSIRHRVLTVSRAFHSRLMDDRMLRELREITAGFTFGPAQLPLLANVTGAVAAADTFDADYWVRHVRNPVLFHAAAARVPELGIDLCLEVGPGRVLGALVTDAGSAPAGTVLASLPKPGQDRAGMLRAAKALFEAGRNLNWAAVQQASGAGGRRVAAPRYPFAGAAHWADSHRRRPHAGTAGALCGYELRSPALSGTRVFEFERGESYPPHQADHRLYGTVVTAGASHLATIFAALGGDAGPLIVEDLIFHRPQVIGSGDVRLTQLVVQGSAISVHSRAEDGPQRWVTHLTARTGAQRDAGAEPGPGSQVGEFPVADRAAFIAGADRHIPAADFYRRSGELGYTHGLSYRWVTDIWVRGEQALLRYAEPPMLDDAFKDGFHPGLIDSFLQGIAAFAGFPPTGQDGQVELADSLAVPFAAARLAFFAGAGGSGELWGHVRASDARPAPDGGLLVDRADLCVADAEGRVVFAADGFRTRHATRAALERMVQPATALAYEPVWVRRPPAVVKEGAEPARGAVVIYGAADALAADLIDQFRQLGLRARALPAGRSLPAAALVVDARFLDDAGRPARDAAVELAGTLAAAPPGALHAVLGHAGPRSAPLRETLWALLAALEAEDADRRLMRVTLGTGWTPQALAEALVGNLDPEQFEPRLLLDAHDVWIARLRPVPFEAETAGIAQHQPGGSVLITGGFGGLGLSLLRLAARDGAEALTVLSRSAPGPAAQAVIAELERAGVPVTPLTGDVSDPEACARAVTEAARHAPLRRVFHLAGALRDRAFANLTPADFDHVFAAKAGGALALADALRAHRDTLQSFVLFSSASSILGAPGQANYAAANGFLNGLAEQLRAEDLPAVAIAWGPWIPELPDPPEPSGAEPPTDPRGMATGTAATRAGARRGVRPLTDEEAADLLGLAQHRSAPGLLAVAADFDTYAEQLGVRPAAKLVEHLVSARTPAAARAADRGGRRGWLRERLDAGAADPAVRLGTLREAIRTALRDILGPMPGEDGVIDDDLAFAALGLDSITMIDLRTHLAQALGADLPATVAVDHPSIARLSEYILDSGLVNPS